MVHMLFTYPAKEADVIKIRRMNSKSYLVKETPEIYTNIVKPIITKPSPSRNLQWLDNILQKKEEADRIIYDDPDPRTGFVLLPNHNWENKENIHNLYCLGICYQRVLSLREIRGEHISLLENMLETGCKAIEDKYGLKANQIRVFLHYQPSFYHLHVHYTNLACNVPQAIVERAHLLQDVIDNLKTDPDYYQHKTLYYRVLNTDEIALALNL
jgi:m7GpppX diphosphatase